MPSRAEKFAKRIFIIVLIIAIGSVVYIVLSGLQLELYYATWAPVVTPAYSAQELWTNPLPKPDVIRNVETKTISRNDGKQSLCVDLNTGLLWQPGDEGESILNKIFETFGVTVDGQIVSRRNFQISEVATLIIRRDDKGNVSGSHGGPITICIFVPELTGELHTATIRFENTKRTIFIHEWAFQVTNT
jgi:hypothetical protein